MPEYTISLADGTTETLAGGVCKISGGSLVLFAPTTLMLAEPMVLAAWAPGVWSSVHAETEAEPELAPAQQVIDQEPRVLAQAEIPHPRGVRGHDWPYGL